MIFIKKFFLAYILISLLSLSAFGQTLKKLTLAPTLDDFANPERGWMSSEEVLNENFAQELWPNKPTSRISWIRWTISDFIGGKDLTPKFYSEFQKMCDEAKKRGLKIIPRVRYTDDRGPDAPVATVLKHIAQLKDIFKKNSDVIYLVDPGMIGFWGEWHSTTNNLLTLENRNSIIEAVLNTTPPDRMMYIRYPVYKMDYIKSKGFTNSTLDSAHAFNGSDIARIGHMNDCLFSTADDAGTYYPQSSTTFINREIGLNYVQQESPFVPHGGETCKEPDGVGLNSYNDCKEVLVNFPKLHTNHLNSEYSEEIYWKWQRDSCYNLISRSLGYRFAITTGEYTQNIKPGGLMNLSFNIENSGFGELVNPRDVYVVLQNQKGETKEAVLSIDPRWWGGGSKHQVDLKLEIPTSLGEGTYNLALWFPDKYESIKKDYRYAIRLANKDVWDSTTGLNIIARDIIVSNANPGIVNNAYTAFKQSSINSNSPILKNTVKENFSFQYLPSNHKILLNNFSRTSKIKIQIYNSFGTSLFTAENKTSRSQSVFEWTAPNLTSGTYWVSVITDQQSLFQKIIQL